MDSIQKILDEKPNDLARLRYLAYWVEAESDSKVWTKYNAKMKQIALNHVKLNQRKFDDSEVKFAFHLATTLNNEGFFFDESGEGLKARSKYIESLDLFLILKIPDQIANCYGNIGMLDWRTGSHKNAIVNTRKALGIAEKIKDTAAISVYLNNLGAIFQEQENEEQAIFYFSESLKIKRKLKKLEGISVTLNNLGILYFNQLSSTFKDNSYLLQKITSAQKEKVLVCMEEALAVRLKVGDSNSIADSYVNLGRVRSEFGEKELGLSYLMRALKILKRKENNLTLLRCESQLAFTYLANGDTKMSKVYALSSFRLANTMNILISKIASCKALMEISVKEKDYKSALKYTELHELLNDSLVNSETQEATIDAQLGYEYDKRVLSDEVKTLVKLQVIKTKLNAERIQQYGLIGFLAIASGLGFFLNKTLKRNRNANKLIAEQKQNVEQKIEIIQSKQTEIIENITYAHRIQSCLLATDKELKNMFNDVFVVYQPKDIVSGDFYWSTTLKNGKKALLLGDSTGHGVPGAIMSILNISSLENATDILGFCEPAEILNAARRTIIETLNKDKQTDGGNDGMDCSLVVFDKPNSIATISSAFNSVLILRDSEWIEINADRMPVGKHHSDQILFSQKEVKIVKNDQMFLFTDGFADQFGGQAGKKYKISKLKQTILSFQNDTGEIQKQKLEEEFQNWKGAYDQLDDVAIIGLKF